MIKEKSKCIDAGSEYCPCYLAEINECITCTRLQGKDFCDCVWSGVCIYQNYFWCGRKKKSIRETYEGFILDKKMISENGMLFRIKITKTLARELKHPGSYVLVRDPQKPHFFDVPMSIMNANQYKGEIEVAVQILGVKTKSLFHCNKNILIKGPFWNGILGLKDLKNTVNENVLVIARGIALAPSLLVIKYLLKNHNNITFAMDYGKIGVNFIEEYIQDLNIQTTEINLRSENGLNVILDMIRSGKFHLIFSGGADKLHNILLNEVNKTLTPMKFVVTNNSRICCGEGICGACTCKTSDGTIIKMCKTQVHAKWALERGK